MPPQVDSALASVDARRQTLTVRRTLEGKQRAVLHLAAATLAPVDDEGEIALHAVAD
jgi:hypothetical protein